MIGRSENIPECTCTYFDRGDIVFSVGMMRLVLEDEGVAQDVRDIQSQRLLHRICLCMGKYVSSCFRTFKLSQFALFPPLTLALAAVWH